MFCLLLGTALFMTLAKALPALPTDILVIRDETAEGEYVASEGDVETEETNRPPDQVITDPFANIVSRRTSFALEDETGNDPAETLAAYRPETTAPEKEPEPVIGLADRIPPDYDYTLPVPEADPVTLDYFSDAVLVGDSRMQGLILYCGLSRITNYTYKGLTVDSVFSRPVIEWTEAEDLPEEEKIPEELWENGKVPVLEALKQTEYSKVYIMLGINETGWPEPSFFPEVYSGVIDAIREDNPQCLIYVLSVFPVTKVVEEWHDFVTNEKISLYNRYLQEMAAEKQVFFVDLSPAVADETGVLPPDSGVDGIHLNKEYCMKVLEYLYSHTVPLLPAEEAAAKETAES